MKLGKSVRKVGVSTVPDLAKSLAKAPVSQKVTSRSRDTDVLILQDYAWIFPNSLNCSEPALAIQFVVSSFDRLAQTQQPALCDSLYRFTKYVITRS
jgi:hypothetical protein